MYTGSGLEDINGVFEESNTYQPSVPSSEAEIIVMFYCTTCFVKIFLICRIRFQILQENFRGVEKDLHQEFIIDNTLGRDVKFTLDESGSGNSDRITRIKLLYANGTEFYRTNNIVNTFSTTFDFLEVRLKLYLKILLCYIPK